VVTHQLQVERRTAKTHRPKTNSLTLDHATNVVRLVFFAAGRCFRRVFLSVSRVMTRSPASRKRHVCETRFTSNKQERNVPDVLSGHVTRSGMPRPSDRGSPTTTRRRIIGIFPSRNKTYSIYHADRAISWQIVSRLLGISAFQHTQPASCITFTLRNKYGGYYRHASYFCSRCETAIHRVK